MRKILAEQRIIAKDQNKVFVELADARKLSPSDARERYGLGRGKGNAFVEFDIEEVSLSVQYNRRLKSNEYFVLGDVDLSNRNVEAFFNF